MRVYCLLKKFDIGKILEHGRERFTAFLKKTDLLTLVGYNEAGGRKISTIKEIPNDWKKKIQEIQESRQFKKEIFLINPKLYFLTPSRCSELALQELLARIEGNSRHLS